jgi:hypothetical protein
MTYPHTPPWALRTCLLCGATPEVGHQPACPASDPNATGYLTEHLPDGTQRTWTMAGLRYTATPARRAALTAAMAQMMWVPAGRQVNLPFMTGALIQEVVPQLGIGRWLAQIGYHPLATIRVPDCGCSDPLRCRCDFPDHPHAQAHPDLWADYAVLALRCRRPQGWLDWWLLDIGIGAVVIADDDRTGDPIPADASHNCQMGWCDLCDGTRRLRGTPPCTGACTHACHHTDPGNRVGSEPGSGVG